MGTVICNLDSSTYSNLKKVIKSTIKYTKFIDVFDISNGESVISGNASDISIDFTPIGVNEFVLLSPEKYEKILDIFDGKSVSVVDETDGHNHKFVFKSGRTRYEFSGSVYNDSKKNRILTGESTELLSTKTIENTLLKDIEVVFSTIPQENSKKIKLEIVKNSDENFIKRLSINAGNTFTFDVDDREDVETEDTFNIEVKNIVPPQFKSITDLTVKIMQKEEDDFYLVSVFTFEKVIFTYTERCNGVEKVLEKEDIDMENIIDDLDFL
jgi:hypothetical protein